MKIDVYRNYDEKEVLNLYSSVGWTNYTASPAMVRAAFAGSLLVLGAFDGEKLVGFLRAVGDGASILYIQDIVVSPGYQRRGIGTALLHCALDWFPSVYQTVLMTDNTEKTNAFYRSCGFVRADDMGCCGFLWVTT